MRSLIGVLSAIALGAIALAAPAAKGEEGMWTFDHFPAAQMRADVGWAPDQAWLDRVMNGVARLPGCSGAVVSGEGALVTNHHCIVDCIEALSNNSTNYLDTGFLARRRADERRCPGLSVQVLAGVADVTDRIAAAAAGVGAQGFARARDQAIARMQAECAQGAVGCEVVTLYQGGRYALYRYKRYDDVRLVFAPERAAAAFGGDADNFNFPRYDVDVAFLRLYENGAPAVTPAHLAMRFTPLAENDVVLVAGNPGPTARLRSSAELAFQRDVELPWLIEVLGEARTHLGAFAARGPNQAREASSAVQSVENAYKALLGRQQALANAAGFARIADDETDLQERIHRNVALQRDVGDAWGDIVRAVTAYREIFYAYQYLELRAGERSQLFGWARDIVRGAAEREIPDAARLPRYTEPRLPRVEASLGADIAIDPEYEALNLDLWLSQLRAHLNAAAAQRVLGAESPEALSQRLSQSHLADPGFRQQLWSGGAAAVAASDDPMIAFVRAWDADARAVRARFESEVAAPIVRAQERIAAARFRIFGLSQYPEATFSPRISYGRVEGWRDPSAGAVPAFTRFSGLYQHATGTPPFALAPRWAAARTRVDPSTIFDVATSTDVTGGNSGSALLDQQGMVVGVVFDGNMYSLGGEYFYDEALNRTVSVSSTAIEAALGDVYGMDALLAELRGSSQ
jgi:hypothetical protein